MDTDTIFPSFFVASLSSLSLQKIKKKVQTILQPKVTKKSPQTAMTRAKV